MNGFFRPQCTWALLFCVASGIISVADENPPNAEQVGGVFRGHVAGWGEVSLSLSPSTSIAKDYASPPYARLRYAYGYLTAPDDPLPQSGGGTVDGKGVWMIKLERAKRGDRAYTPNLKLLQLGRITGQVTGPTFAFVGTWMSPDGKVKRPLRLTRIAEWYVVEEKFRLRSGERGETWDFEGTLPKFIDESAWLQKLSDQLREEVETQANEFTKHAKAHKFGDLPENSNRGQGSAHCSETRGYSVWLQTDGVVSLQSEGSTYTGGAHPFGGDGGRNFWKRDDRPEQFKLADVFVKDSNWVKRLSDLCMADLRDQGAEWVVAPPSPELRVTSLDENHLNAFTFNRAGFCFHFNYWHVAPYPNSFVVHVPWKKVQDILRKDTPVAKLIDLQ